MFTRSHVEEVLKCNKLGKRAEVCFLYGEVLGEKQYLTDEHNSILQDKCLMLAHKCCQHIWKKKQLWNVSVWVSVSWFLSREPICSYPHRCTEKGVSSEWLLHQIWLGPRSQWLILCKQSERPGWAKDTVPLPLPERQGGKYLNILIIIIIIISWYLAEFLLFRIHLSFIINAFLNVNSCWLNK